MGQWAHLVGLGVWRRRRENVLPLRLRWIREVRVAVVGGVVVGVVAGGVVGVEGVQEAGIIWMKTFGSGSHQRKWMSAGVWRGNGMVGVVVSVGIHGSRTRTSALALLMRMAAGMGRCVT